MKRPFRVLIIAAAIAYLGLCGSLYFSQRSLIYFPTPRSGSGGETITLPIANERVLVSMRPLDGARALIYFGGNAEDVSRSLPGLSAAFPDNAIYLLHYRGYGGSSGSPSEEAFFADALTLFDQVHPQHPNIEVVGRSLGSGVAVYVASMRPVTRLVLVTPFDSMEEVAELQYPYVPVRWLLLDKFESWRYAPRITAPTVILAAEHDEIVPRANTELLRARFQSGLISFHVLAGTGHNSISESPEYMALLKGSP
jgi:pimeloyl-ACP methyl ester carboxylesterase